MLLPSLRNRISGRCVGFFFLFFFNSGTRVATLHIVYICCPKLCLRSGDYSPISKALMDIVFAFALFGEGVHLEIACGAWKTCPWFLCRSRAGEDRCVVLDSWTWVTSTPPLLPPEDVLHVYSVAAHVFGSSIRGWIRLASWGAWEQYGAWCPPPWWTEVFWDVGSIRHSLQGMFCWRLSSSILFCWCTLLLALFAMIFSFSGHPSSWTVCWPCFVAMCHLRWLLRWTWQQKAWVGILSPATKKDLKVPLACAVIRQTSGVGGLSCNSLLVV